MSPTDAPSAHPGPASADGVLNGGPWLVVRFDPADLHVTEVTTNVGWILGFRAEDLVTSGVFWTAVVHPDDSARLAAVLRGSLAACVTHAGSDCRCRGGDGRYRWFDLQLRIEYDDAARAITITGYAQDISERKAAEEAEHRSHAFLDSVFEHLPSGVFIKDARNLRYVRVNRASADLFGVDRPAMLGRTDAEMFPAALASAYEARDREVVAQRAPLDTPGEVVATRRQGARVVHTRRIPILGGDGEVEYILGITDDVTERRTAHEEGRLARLEAERANRAKSEFLSRMSHDLRTPLNAVLGYAQVLAMDTLSAEQADSIQQILKGGSHVLELVNEVLDIARIEAGHLSLSREPVAVSDIVPQVVEFARTLGSARGIAVTCDVSLCGGLHATADRQRLRQVLLNLVSNGVKYNRDNGRVHVTCKAAHGRVRIEVADTGPGIPLDKQGRLFQPFERLGAEQSAIEGTGLGLAVSKGLTEAMGGRIGLHSTSEGTTFWIELPPADSPPARADAEAAALAGPPRAGAAGTVLYVEDNRSNVRLLERLLARRPGVRLAAAPTGSAALQLARLERPDLILLDLHLPDMPGDEVLCRLKADAATRDVPVVVLSADATASQQEKLIQGGAAAYLTKPLDLSALLALLDERLSPCRDRTHGA